MPVAEQEVGQQGTNTEFLDDETKSALVSVLQRLLFIQLSEIVVDAKEDFDRYHALLANEGCLESDATAESFPAPFIKWLLDLRAVVGEVCQHLSGIGSQPVDIGQLEHCVTILEEHLMRSPLTSLRAFCNTLLAGRGPQNVELSNPPRATSAHVRSRSGPVMGMDATPQEIAELESKLVCLLEKEKVLPRKEIAKRLEVSERSLRQAIYSLMAREVISPTIDWKIRLSGTAVPR